MRAAAVQKAVRVKLGVQLLRGGTASGNGVLWQLGTAPNVVGWVDGCRCQEMGWRHNTGHTGGRHMEVGRKMLLLSYPRDLAPCALSFRHQMLNAP